MSKSSFILHPIIFFIFFALAFSFQKSLKAQVIDSIYYGWTVYEYNDEDDEKQCYIGSSPQNSITSHTSIREPYILITRFSRSRMEEISIYSGYEYKLNSKVRLLIPDDHQFRLFTSGDMAWVRNDFEDKEIIELMLVSPSIKVRSDSSIGTYAVDEYSTRGLTRAYARMKELCK